MCVTRWQKLRTEKINNLLRNAALKVSETRWSGVASEVRRDCGELASSVANSGEVLTG